MNSSSQISRTVLNKTFPYYIKIDKSNIVRDAGKSLLKLRGDIIGKDINEVLSIKRPHNLSLSYNELSQSEDKLVLCGVRLNTGEAFYKCQVLSLAEERRLVFLGSLFLSDPNDLEKHNISLTDFSISDASADMLQLIQVNKMVTEDLEKLNGILKEKEKKYSTIIEQADEIIFTTNERGDFTFMNELGQQLMGLSEADMGKVSFTAVVQPEYVEKIMKIGRALLNKEITSGYVEFKLKDEEVWIGQNMTLNEGSDGGFQGIARDITETKEYQRLLMEEREKAQNAASSKSRFLANMSHEIRTPLNGIMGLTNLLMSDNLNDQQRKYLNAIKSSSETLMVVINDILDFSKIDSGKMQIRKAPFDLKLCMGQLVEIMDSKAKEKNLKLSINYDSEIPEQLLGDEARLNQILYNLVGNAIKFTKEGSVDLDARITAKEEDSVRLLIDVKDTGIGIPKSKLGNIFRAFRQVDDSDVREEKGTGLGLTITKRLCELMGGQLNVKSKLGEGSCFSVEIPFPIAGPKQSENLSEKNEVSEMSVLSSAKILLAEDNPVNQLVTIDILKDFGLEVDLAENGQEAVDKMNESPYDLIMMDMQMPVMDGYDAMEIIKGKYHESVKILALTAHVTEGEIQRCKDHGADEYLSKPFKPQELYEKLGLLHAQLPSKEFELGEQADDISDQKVIDFTQLENFTQKNTDIMCSTLHLLATELPADIYRIQEQINAESYERLKAAAHRAKPNFELVLSPAFAGIIAFIEKEASKMGDFNKMQERLDALKVVFGEVEREINLKIKILKG